MTYFFTSDTHFGHENIIKYCNRPFKNVIEMNEIIIKNWNKIVKKDDTIYHLGDFSFGNFYKYKNKLNGNIILIEGNHDRNQVVIKEMIIEYDGNEWYLSHIPPETNEHQFCLCGHVHEKWKSKRIGNKIIINVGVDVWNFKPITMKEILKEYKN